MIRNGGVINSANNFPQSEHRSSAGHFASTSSPYGSGDLTGHEEVYDVKHPVVRVAFESER